MRWLLRVTFLRMALLFGVILFFAYSPYDFTARGRKKRAQATSQSGTPMEFAVVWPRTEGHMFVEGAATAVEEINSRGGITLADERGNPVKTRLVMHVFDEQQDKKIEKLATRIADNPNLSAVIGHSQPDSAIRASICYQDRGLVFVSPAVSDKQLLHHSFWGCVQTVPDDEEISRSMVRFALEHGWKRAAIVYARNTYGATYEKLLRQHMGELSARDIQNTNQVSRLDLVFQGYYAENEKIFYPLISSLLQRNCDVVFLVDSLVGDSTPRTLALIEQMRELGVKQPILGTEELHSSQLWPALGQKANGVFAMSPFDPHSYKSNEIAREFRVAFRKAYTMPPTMHAGEAYESVHLLAQAAERARSKVPIKIATMFKSTSRWDGLQGNGAYDFSLSGAIQKKKVVMEEMKDGIFIEPTVPQTCITTSKLAQTHERSALN